MIFWRVADLASNMPYQRAVEAMNWANGHPPSHDLIMALSDATFRTRSHNMPGMDKVMTDNGMHFVFLRAPSREDFEALERCGFAGDGARMYAILAPLH